MHPRLTFQHLGMLIASMLCCRRKSVPKRVAEFATVGRKFPVNRTENDVSDGIVRVVRIQMWNDITDSLARLPPLRRKLAA